jgi:hypothetical protein
MTTRTLTIYKPDGTKEIKCTNSDHSTNRVAYCEAGLLREYEEYRHLPDFTAVLS